MLWPPGCAPTPATDLHCAPTPQTAPPSAPPGAVCGQQPPHIGAQPLCMQQQTDSGGQIICRALRLGPHIDTQQLCCPAGWSRLTMQRQVPSTRHTPFRLPAAPWVPWRLGPCRQLADANISPRLSDGCSLQNLLLAGRPVPLFRLCMPRMASIAELR